jgi:hypothetical protein
MIKLFIDSFILILASIGFAIVFDRILFFSLNYQIILMNLKRQERIYRFVAKDKIILILFYLLPFDLMGIIRIYSKVYLSNIALALLILSIFNFAVYYLYFAYQHFKKP